MAPQASTESLDEGSYSSVVAPPVPDKNFDSPRTSHGSTSHGGTPPAHSANSPRLPPRNSDGAAYEAISNTVTVTTTAAAAAAGIFTFYLTESIIGSLVMNSDALPAGADMSSLSSGPLQNGSTTGMKIYHGFLRITYWPNLNTH